MMNVLLLIIFLNNWLSDELLPGHLNSLSSAYIIYKGTLDNGFYNHFLIRLSINLNINSFSLNYRLNQCLIINLSSRSLNSFDPIIISINRLSSHCIQLDYLIFLRNQFYLFFVVDDLFLINWLIKYFP